MSGAGTSPAPQTAYTVLYASLTVPAVCEQKPSLPIHTNINDDKLHFWHKALFNYFWWYFAFSDNICF